jgi:hypothetical protein
MKTISNEALPKLNVLLSEWPKGAVVTLSLLKGRGYSRQLIDKYKLSRWITPVGKGAYQRYQDDIDWFGGLYGLQSAGCKVHVGAKTAMELQGLAHYLAPKLPRCFLFSPTGSRLPKWFSDYDWDLEVIYKTTNLFPGVEDLSFTEYSYKEFTIHISAPERAGLEMMYHIPEKQGFNEAYRIMENLATLRPELVQKLLLACRSVKVKRLFMYMAEKIGHDWLEELHPDKIDFGSGKRVIVKNGILDKKYQITVEAENAY